MYSKGVSAVIATVLMLLITIALAGTAYLYITGVFTARTGIVLSIDSSSTCPAGGINITVKNDGTGVASGISLTVTSPNGTVVPQPPINCINIASATVNAGSTTPLTCISRPAGYPGTYAIRVSSGASAASGSVYCSS